MKNKIFLLGALLVSLMPLQASQQIIFQGTTPNDHTGDNPYVQWVKGNANFTDLYSTVAFLTASSNYFGNLVVLANAQSTNGSPVVFTNNLPTIAVGSGYTITTNVTPTNIIYTLAITTGGAGTVVSAGLALPTVLFNSPVTGSPITTSGSFAPTLANQTANTSLRGPTTGAPGPPTFRADVAADIPNLPGSIITSGTVADAFLSPNIPLLNGNNAFTGTESFAQNLTLNGTANTAPSQTVGANNLVTFSLADARYDALNAAGSLLANSNYWQGTNIYKTNVTLNGIANTAPFQTFGANNLLIGSLGDARYAQFAGSNSWTGTNYFATNVTALGTDNEMPNQTRVNAASVATAGSVTNDITSNTVPVFTVIRSTNGSGTNVNFYSGSSSLVPLSVNVNGTSTNSFMLYSGGTAIGGFSYDGMLRAAGGTPLRAGIGFHQNASNGVYAIGTEAVGITVGSSNAVTITNTGTTILVGINNTNPANALDVTGNLNVTGSATASSFSGSGASLTTLNASQLTSGTVPASQLPLATSSAFGAVQPDNSTIIIAGGVLSVGGGVGGATNGIQQNAGVGTNTTIKGFSETNYAGVGEGLANGQIIIYQTNINTTPTNALVLTNRDTAAVSAAKYSPSFAQSGKGWNTATSVSYDAQARWTVEPASEGDYFGVKYVLDLLTNGVVEEAGMITFGTGNLVSVPNLALAGGTLTFTGIGSLAGGAGGKYTLNATGGQNGTIFTDVFCNPKTTNYQLLITECGTAFNNIASAGPTTNTWPAIVAGQQYTFIAQNAQTLAIQAPASVTFQNGSSFSAAAGQIYTSTTGSSITLLAVSSTNIVATSVVGTWTLH